MIEGFTRQEAIALTGINSGQASYWDSSEIVTPAKYGNPRRPLVVYSPEQIVQLKVVSKLRDSLSLQQVRKIISFIQSNAIALDSDCLMFVNDEVYSSTTPAKLGETILALLPHCPDGVLVREIGSIKGAIAEIIEAGTEVLDFDKRIQGTILDRSDRP